MTKIYEIGPLQLDPEARVLTQGGVPMALGARGVAVLAALVSRPNQYMSKAAIMDEAWPGLVVEDGNLAVQISLVRRALALVPGGEGWIETLARRGYRFVGPVIERAGRSGHGTVADRGITNLPQALQSFVGRERELAAIKRLLPGTRLLTLTGTGGIGKTRLALQVASEVRDAYRGAIWFVDLAPLVDPGLVPSAMAQVLGVAESTGQPLVKTLSDHLRTREVLLILDNCEHVLTSCANLAGTLLREAAGLTLLATSREPLRIGAEQTYLLDALPLPDPNTNAQTIARSDSVQLFVERARQHRPRFDLREERAQVVAEICVRLDGIPLALELAAARIGVLPVDQILRLLGQRFRLLTSGSRSELPRHQTLRALLDWSFDLLDEAEKHLFARLSVFPGGWTLAAAEAVCAGEPIGKEEVVYLLIAIVEKSLVLASEDGDRYRMLETVRQYAREKLTESGSEALREQHRDYFLALAEEAAQQLRGPEQAAWLRRLEDDHDNLRAGLEWSFMQASVVEGLQLCGSLARFWMDHAHFAEGREWCARMLTLPGAEKRTLDRARALDSGGVLAYFQGDYAAARGMHEESLAIAREQGNRRRVASSLACLSSVAFEQGDDIASRALQEENLAILRELGNRNGIATALNNLGHVSAVQGDIAAARALYEESLAIGRELGNRAHIAVALGSLATVASQQGEISFAEALFRESLTIARELGNRYVMARALSGLGEVAVVRGEFATAQALHGESLAIGRELGDRDGIATYLGNLGIIACEQSDYESARTLHHESYLIRRELGDKRGIAYSMEELAGVIAVSGSLVDAARIWGSAAQLRQEIRSPLVLKDRDRYARRVAAARATRGDDAAFDHAWREGRAMSYEQAIDLAFKNETNQK